MKKAYEKPQLDTKGYAQFENVFTACNKVQSDGNCYFVDNPDWPPAGSPNSSFKIHSST